MLIWYVWKYDFELSMKRSAKVYNSIDDYVAAFPEGIRSKLQGLRQAIRDSAPGATEIISYQMPAFKLNGILVYFAAFKSHIGFYPTSSGVEAFKEELSGYEVAKGTIRFPLDKPIPFDLVKKIVEFRVREKMSKKKQAK